MQIFAPLIFLLVGFSFDLGSEGVNFFLPFLKLILYLSHLSFFHLEAFLKICLVIGQNFCILNFFLPQFGFLMKKSLLQFLKLTMMPYCLFLKLSLTFFDFVPKLHD